MPDIKHIEVDEILYDLKDETARTHIGDVSALGTNAKDDLVVAINEMLGRIASLSGITYIQSNDTANLVVLRSLESGTYVLQGKFRPYEGSPRTLTFSSNLLVNVVTRTAGTHVQIFYPVNNVIQFLSITDDSYERTDIYMNKLLSAPNTGAVGQVLKVSAVDDSGAITAVEAADLTPSIVTLTQNEYDALIDAGTVDPDTMYMIVRDDT